MSARRSWPGIIPRVRKESFRVDTSYEIVKEKISLFFNAFGILVGRYPKSFSLVPLFLCLGLGVGILRLKRNDNTEEIFTPVGSRIFSDRQRLKDMFPDSTSWNFDAFGLVDVPALAVLLFRAGGQDVSSRESFSPADIDDQHDNHSIFDPHVLWQIRDLVAKVAAINVTVDGVVYGTEDLCARSSGRCAVDGVQYLEESFVSAVRAGNVTYPVYMASFGYVDLSLNLVGVQTSSRGLVSARVIKIRWYWRVDRFDVAKVWNRKFQEAMAEVEGEGFTGDLDFAYSTSISLEEELVKGTTGDIIYFLLTMLLMVLYSILVSTGGDAVSTRALLACGGVLAAALGIVSAFGLLALFGVQIVSFVGLMPFLVLGIGVDDMFLLMSSWGESIAYRVDVPQRVGITFSKAGIGITITTLTDFFAFLIGISSSFIAVRQFCVYTAMAVLFCYLANCTLFGACMSLHGDRVYAVRHCITCRPAQSRQYYRDQGASICTVYCCGGAVPEREFADESACEKLPRFLLPRIILNPVYKVLILAGLMVYLGSAVYGAIKLEPGMRYVDLVLRSSYYYKFSSWDEAYFGQRLAIAFAVDKEINYTSTEGDIFRRLLNKAQRDKSVDSDCLRCWLHQYSRSPLFPSEPANSSLFMQNLLLFLQANPVLLNDVMLGPGNASVAASRCYVLTINEVSIFEQSGMMLRMRELVDEVTQFPVFVYQPVFVMLEHTIAILPSTLQTVGTAVAVMFVVTLLMLPQLLMVCLVTLNIIFIITCVFGSMYFLEITFSGMSMIHILMSVGFSVDFSAHICAAYLMSESPLRKDRARYALVHASGPIFNGGMSSLVGVSMLMLSESYFFRSFFKIMSMVIISGAVNSVFFMPIILSYIGPENTSTLAHLARLQELKAAAGQGSQHPSDHSGGEEEEEGAQAGTEGSPPPSESQPVDAGKLPQAAKRVSVVVPRDQADAGGMGVSSGLQSPQEVPDLNSAVDPPTEDTTQA